MRFLLLPALFLALCSCHPTRVTATGASTDVNDRPRYHASEVEVRDATKKAVNAFFSQATITETTDTLEASGPAGQRAVFHYTKDSSILGRRLVYVDLSYEAVSGAEKGVKELLRLLEHYLR